jgi:two-component system heavy metal sensor histidine kinase CusS
LQDFCEDVEAMAPQIALRAELTSDVVVTADRDLLAQALQNLFNNAVQYTGEQGEITVRLAETDSAVTLTIANTGQAIPDEARERIFDRFYRIDEARSRDTGGIGLGLSLAREIIRAHSGDLVLGETPDDLISFTLTLPLRDD